MTFYCVCADNIIYIYYKDIYISFIICDIYFTFSQLPYILFTTDVLLLEFIYYLYYIFCILLVLETYYYF